MSAEPSRHAVRPQAPLDQAAIRLRIDFLRITLIMGIVILHTPPTWLLEALPPAAHHWPGVIKLFLDYGPLRAGVPTLSLISGYLLFMRPSRTYAALVHRKFSTLIIPFLIWNGVVIALHALRGQNDLASFQPPIRILGLGCVNLDAFVNGPPNYPTYFLVDLFALALLSPVIGFLLRRAPVPTLIAAGIAAAVGYGPIPTVRADVALPFMAGAAAAIQGVDPRVVDRYVWPLVIGFLAVSVAFIAAVATNVATPISLGLVRTVGVPAVWALSRRAGPDPARSPTGRA